MRRTTLAALLFLGGLVGVVPPAAAAPEQTHDAVETIGIRLLEAPADAADDPRAQLHIVDHLAPGAVVSRRIGVSSTASTTMRVDLYPAAAEIIDGTFTGADGRTANDLSTWISVTPQPIDVPAGGEETATVVIAVADDAPPGEHYGVVWAEVGAAGAAIGAMTQVSRVGIRLYVSVGPGGAPATDFAVDSLTARRAPTGTPQVVATVRNTGGRALDLTGTLELTEGPGGVRAGPFLVAVGTTVAVGGTADVTITLDDDLPAGPWDAVVDLRSGQVERRAQATITFPEAGTAAAVPTATLKPGSRWPAVAAMVAAGLIVVLAAVLWRRRRGRVERRAHLLVAG